MIAENHQESPTRKSFLGEVDVADIKTGVTIILILDNINQVTTANCMK